jgi:pheromone alpha factor receptor
MPLLRTYMGDSQTMATQISSKFNPFDQTFHLLYPNGQEVVTARMADIFLVQQQAVSQAITQAVQIGMCMILLVILLLVTRKEKLLSMVFLVNVLALLCVSLRGILALCVVTGPLYNFYRYEVGYYDNMGDAKTISTAGEVMSCLVTIFIQFSLVFQAKIVCSGLDTWKGIALVGINCVAALSSATIRFALMVLNIKWNILHVQDETQTQFDTLGTLASATNITLVISIGVSTLIFTGKLWFAIRNRRQLGMKQFGPMQIIFVMGCQTMFTPRKFFCPSKLITANPCTVIFTIVVYFGVKHGQITSFVPTVVAISLPLSAMWAAVNTSHAHIATSHVDNPRAIPVGNPNLGTDKSDCCSCGKNSMLFTNSTLVDDESSKGLNSRRAWSAARSDSGNGGSNDLEMGRLTDARCGTVYIDRTYTVTSD